MLPVAALPVAAILSGFGHLFGTLFGADNIVAAFLTAAGGALIGNIALLFAVGVAIGMASRSDGTSALAGLVSWLTVTTLLAPGTMANLQGIPEDEVARAFSSVENVFVGIVCGLIGAWSYDRFKDVKLPDYLGFFSGKRSVAIVASGISLLASIILMFVWPLLFAGLTAFGEFIATLGPVGAGLYGFFNRLLIPLGLHHALNAVFWFDGFGIADLVKFLAGEGTYGVTGQYMTGFFPIMMFGLPGAALAMYVTAKSKNKKIVGGILFSAAFASFLVGITEPFEFLFMFLAPGLYVVHAVFTGISMAITAALPIRSGFGFSAGSIDLFLSWFNPMAQNPWGVLVLGVFWFAVYFFVFRWIILKWNLRTPGRGDNEDLLGDSADADGGPVSAEEKFLVTGDRFLTALGGKDNITEIENCATRLRLQVADMDVVDEAELKAAGAAGVIKPGGKSLQVIYGLNVQFVKDAMEGLMDGTLEPPSAKELQEVQAAEANADHSLSLVRLRQPVDGTVVSLDEVPDSTFATRVLGGGLAVQPTGDLVVAPAAGVVMQAFDTGHAVALTLDDGTDVLIHVGLDTVKMGGEGFELLVTTGQRVRAGDPLIRFDRAAIEAAGFTAITPVVIVGHAESTIEFV